MAVFLIVLSVLMLICGVQCVAAPVQTFSALGWLAGAAIVVVGVAAIFRYAAGRDGRSVWELVGGVAGVPFGILIVANAFAQFATNMVIAYAAAVWLLVYGACGVAEALDLRRLNQALPSQMRTASWLVVMLLGVVTAAMGVICLIQPMVTMLSVGLLIGVSILIAGIKTLILAIQTIAAQ